MNQPQAETTNLFWNWKTPSRPQEIFFIWQAYRESLPTNINLFKSKCVTNNLCPLCRLEQETHLHALRDYNQAKQIWSSLHPTPQFFDKPFKHWIKENIKNTEIAALGIPWQIIFSYAARTIWLIRNKNFSKNSP